MIIFAGIVAQIPTNLLRLLSDQQNGWWLFLVTMVILVLTIFAIVFVQQGRRNVPVLFPGRRIGNRMSMPVRSNLPLMVNMAGMIPLIFAQSLMTFPAIIASYFINSKTAWIAGFSNGVYNLFNGQGGGYALMFFVMVVLVHIFLYGCTICTTELWRQLETSGRSNSRCLKRCSNSKVSHQSTTTELLFLEHFSWVWLQFCRI